MNVFEAGGDSTDTEGRVDGMFESSGIWNSLLTYTGPHVWFNKFAKDTLHVGNASVDGYPIGMAGLDYGEYLNPQANIGLGRNSTFLNALKDAGHISSRVWGYWPGIDSASERSYGRLDCFRWIRCGEDDWCKSHSAVSTAFQGLSVWHVSDPHEYATRFSEWYRSRSPGPSDYIGLLQSQLPVHHDRGVESLLQQIPRIYGCYTYRLDQAALQPT